MVGDVIRRVISWCLVMAGFAVCAPAAEGMEVILTGGVALKTWENLRGPAKHDNWWANFVRASTVRMSLARQENPAEKFVWIVYRPAYVTRGKEDGKDYVSNIVETAAKYKVKLVLVDTADQAFAAINSVPQQSGELITSFYYFGHSNAHAFMLDYSNSIIGSSKQWMHEDDLSKKLNRNVFAPNAKCFSYGCYTGVSMSGKWRAATGIPMLGNTASTRYQPVGDGRMPEGGGKWKY